MHSYFVKKTLLRSVLATLLLLYTANLPLCAEGEDEENPVSNVRVSKQGPENIFIEYDLSGSDDETFTVTVAVKLESDTTYTYTPVNVIGDIGSNIRPGKNRRISWRTSDENVPALQASDMKLVVHAVSPFSGGKSNTGLFIAGGAAVVGLGLAIILLSTGKTEGGQSSNTFPLPPGRP